MWELRQIQMTDEQKQVKSVELAKQARWMLYLCPGLFLGGAVFLLINLVDWIKSPHFLWASHLVGDCGFVWFGAAGFLDARYTLRTGMKRQSSGRLAGWFLIALGQIGRNISQHEPLFFFGLGYWLRHSDGAFSVSRFSVPAATKLHKKQHRVTGDTKMQTTQLSQAENEKQKALMKRAWWNVRLIPVGYLVVVGITIFLMLTPKLTMTWQEEVLLQIMVCGLFTWLTFFYFDEKVVLRTGKEHTSVGSTAGLLLCLIGMAGLLRYDRKPSPVQWYLVVMLFINVLTGTTKHIAVFRERRRQKQITQRYHGEK